MKYFNIEIVENFRKMDESYLSYKMYDSFSGIEFFMLEVDLNNHKIPYKRK
jgi:hypothetical protein